MRFLQLLPERILDLDSGNESNMKYEMTGIKVKRNELEEYKRVRPICDFSC